MIKAVFFDLDGTLLSHTTSQIPQSTREALAVLRRRGIRVCLATGRSIQELDRLIGDTLRFDCHITLNGQLGLDEKRQEFFSAPIPEEALAQMLAAFRSHEFPIVLVQREGMVTNYTDPLIERTQAEISSPVPPIGAYPGGEVYQFVAYGSEELLRSLAHRYPGCKLTRWHPNGADIISISGGKVAGIREYLRRSGLTPEQIMAIGDGENDMDMLRFAGIGVAMGNAGPAVKASADYVTGHIDEGGLAQALAHFGLI